MKNMKQQAQKGFTLIELMIVIAIIGILAAVALPQYQSYTASGSATACFREIDPGKTEFEILTLAGTTITATTNLKMGAPKACSSHVITATSISGVMKGSVAINTHPLVLTRDATTGVWTCTAPLVTDKSVLPADCRG